MHFTVIQVVATLVAFLAQFSRIFSATKPFWGKLPAVIQVWLPPIIPFAAALQAALAGVTTWTDFAVALIVSAALLLPGAPSNRSAAPLQDYRAPYVPPMPLLFLLILVLACGLSGCATSKPPCDQARLAAVVAVCAAQSQQCVSAGKSEAECQTLTDCDAAIEKACGQ